MLSASARNVLALALTVACVTTTPSAGYLKEVSALKLKLRGPEYESLESFGDLEEPMRPEPISQVRTNVAVADVAVAVADGVGLSGNPNYVDVLEDEEERESKAAEQEFLLEVMYMKDDIYITLPALWKRARDSVFNEEDEEDTKPENVLKTLKDAFNELVEEYQAKARPRGLTIYDRNLIFGTHFSNLEKKLDDISYYLAHR